VVLKNISKSFGATEALKSVNFTLKKGEIHAIVGENGAGKTTLVNILFGLIKNDFGDIIVRGIHYKNMSPAISKKVGIALIPQKLQLISELSIGENLFLNSWPKKKPLNLISWTEIKHKSEVLLNKLKVDLDPSIKVGNLRYVDQQIIAITKSFFEDQADIIILDEPTAPLAAHEIELLFKFIRSLKNEGTSFVYISHYLDEVLKISNRVTVLRDGKVVCVNITNQLNIKELVKNMVGEDVDLYPKRNPQHGEVLLEVNNLSIKPLLKDITFNLNRGEILGIAGLKGSGRTELARSICGLDKFDSGKTILRGEDIKLKGVMEGLNIGIGYLPEDRITWGLFQDRSTRENITITFLKKITNMMRLIRVKKEKKLVNNYVKKLNIKLSSIDQLLNQLSGGNQQKVMISKLLGCDLEVFIFDDPTFGIDIKAKMHIHQVMNELTYQGKSILLISSDMNELEGMCDRIIVLRDSRIAGEYLRDKFNEIQL
jgi:ribose transport system ATP-binding protein